MSVPETLAEINNLIQNEPAVLVYFSHDKCSVCRVLKPKVSEMIQQHFPLLRSVYCDVVKSPEAASAYAVFEVPVILVWFEGKETFRFGRNMSLAEMEKSISRPYSYLFG